MKIKVCGTRDRENLQGIISLNPDFIGFIFYEKSPRFVEVMPDVQWPEGIKKVGVFVNAGITEMEEKASQFNLDFIQLHGQEDVETCRLIKEKGIGVIKAFNMVDNFDFQKLEPYKAYVDYFLFDAPAGTLPGGTGNTFNWDALRAYDQQIPYFLSGGISLMHSQAMKSDWMENFPPYALDINSKFEISPGVKNLEWVARFIEEIRN